MNVPSVLEIVCLARIDLLEKILQSVDLCLTLNFKQTLTFLIRYSDFKLGKSALTVNRSTEDFLFRVHQVIIVKVNCLCSCLSILQILLKSHLFKLILNYYWRVVLP